MEFLKNISIYNKSLLDCFDEKGYKNEIIGIYNPHLVKISDFIKTHQDLGFRFLIYSKDKKLKENDLNIKVETDFRKFYKKIDLFVLNSIDDYHYLIEDLAGMKEKIFIIEEN